ncbi:galactose-binding domain-like protein [Phaeosphaeria sp. MPI-PUGE-AT-0046c]|nr:galactose-binding domain-like protein [Phaeosphaeria sp. MPI-PUGE-AT-0046c]
MPPSLRNRTQALDPDETDSDVELSFTGVRQRQQQQQQQQQHQHQLQAGHVDSQDEEEGEEEEIEDEEEEDDDLIDPSSPPNPNQPPLPNNDPPPSYLRDISTLASWTVSSSKPGCSVPQLRHPSTSLFWQSDGPQPHYLNIHFSKLVRVVALRLYLDFEIDESYTPTKILFLAGSGGNDLVEWGELKCESPRGWVWVDFSGVDDNDDDDDEDEDNPAPPHAPLLLANGQPTTNGADASSDSENNNPLPLPLPNPHHHHHQYQHLQTPSAQTPPSSITPNPQSRPARHPLSALDHATYAPPLPARKDRSPALPVLRAHLIQVKILENHQNGKDTHLRGLQVFARNDEGEGNKGPRKRRDRVHEEVEVELGGLEGEFGVR